MSLWPGWTSKPPVGTALDRSHPYVNNLIAAWVFNEGSGSPVELVSGLQAATLALPGWGSSPYGPVFKTNGAATGTATYYNTLAGTAAVSVAGRSIAVATLSGNYHATIFERGISGAGWDIKYAETSVSTNFTLYLENGDSGSHRAIITSTAFNTGDWFSWCFTDDGVYANNQRAYLNGAPQALAGAYDPQPVASSANFYIGTADNVNHFTADSFDYIYVWNGVISAKQANDIYNNPWQIFESPLPFWWGQSTGGSYTLLGSPGSFVQTGEASIFRISMPEAAGSFAQTGEPTTLKVKLAGVTGSFAETGSASALGLKIVEAAGSFAETGEPATFALKMIEAPGIFTLTGEEANLNLSGNYTLTADLGAFTETGESTAFKLRMIEAAGAFVETGEAAAFKASIVTAHGSFTESGETSAFHVVLTDSPAAFVLTGESAGLNPSGNYTLTAGLGAFTETGEPSVFDVSAAVLAGSFAESGEPAGFRMDVVAAHGVFVWTGKAATLTSSEVSVFIYIPTDPYATQTTAGSGLGLNPFGTIDVDE